LGRERETEEAFRFGPDPHCKIVEQEKKVYREYPLTFALICKQVKRYDLSSSFFPEWKNAIDEENFLKAADM